MDSFRHTVEAVRQITDIPALAAVIDTFAKINPYTQPPAVRSSTSSNNHARPQRPRKKDYESDILTGSLDLA